MSMTSQPKGRSAPPPEESLAVHFPEIAGELLYADPTTFWPKSNRKVWWCCAGCGHEWEARIANRTFSQIGCPQCRVACSGYQRNRPGYLYLLQAPTHLVYGVTGQHVKVSRFSLYPNDRRLVHMFSGEGENVWLAEREIQTTLAHYRGSNISGEQWESLLLGQVPDVNRICAAHSLTIVQYERAAAFPSVESRYLEFQKHGVKSLSIHDLHVPPRKGSVLGTLTFFAAYPHGRGSARCLCGNEQPVNWREWKRGIATPCSDKRKCPYLLQSELHPK